MALVVVVVGLDVVVVVVEVVVEVEEVSVTLIPGITCTCPSVGRVHGSVVVAGGQVTGA